MENIIFKKNNSDIFLLRIIKNPELSSITQIFVHLEKIFILIIFDLNSLSTNSYDGVFNQWQTLFIYLSEKSQSTFLIISNLLFLLSKINWIHRPQLRYL
jgi:hypothetical protein